MGSSHAQEISKFFSSLNTYTFLLKTPLTSKVYELFGKIYVFDCQVYLYIKKNMWRTNKKIN